MAWFRRTARTARTRKTTFKPSFETLEIRAVPAVSVSLSAAGVLTVNGTTGNDSIVLHQSNGKVTVDGKGANPQAGQIFLQSNGAEIFFRRLDLIPIERKAK